MRRRHVSRPLAGLGLLVGVWLAWAGPAGADVDGPCEASVAGEQVRGRDADDPGDAIEVGAKDRVEVAFRSPAGVASHEIRMAFGPFEWTVSEEVDDGSTTVADVIEVGDYATYGVGLYRVSGTAVLADGQECTGAVLVEVTGKSPLTTVAGVAATAATVGGVAGIGVSTAHAARAARSLPTPTGTRIGEGR